MSARVTRELTLRAARDEDTPAILELMKASLGEGVIPRTREFWDWKHVDKPFGKSPVAIALDGDRLVGVRVFMRWTFRSGSVDFQAVRAVDTATHPDYQGRGIFKRLTLGMLDRVRDEGARFVFNTPNGKSMPGYLKMGWQVVCRLPLWIKPLRPGALALALLAARRGERRLSVENDTSFAASGLEWLESSDAARLGAQREPREGRYHTPIDTAYLRWRYAAIPGFAYAAEAEDSGLAGCVYRRRIRGGLGELRLCELLIDRSLRGVIAGARLLGRVTGASSAAYAAAIAAPGSPEARALLLAGFLPIPRIGPYLTVRLLTEQRAYLPPEKFESYRASIGDLELF